MPGKVVKIPGVGIVRFPEGMSDDQIVAEIGKMSPPSGSSPSTAERAATIAGETAADAVTGAALMGSIIDPVVAGAGAAGSYLVPYTAGHFWDAGGRELGPDATLGERFRGEMEGLRGRRAEANQRSPVAFKVGMAAPAVLAPETLGSLPSMSKTAASLPVLVRAGAGAADAALYSGLSAAASNIDRDPLAAASSAASDPSTLALGAGFPVAAAAVPAVGRVARSGADALRDVAMSQGRKVLAGGVTPLSVRKPIPESAVRAALDEGTIRPLGTTAGTSERLDAARAEWGQRYSDILAELDARGVTGPAKARLASQLMAEAQSTGGVTLGSPKPGMYRDAAAELMSPAGTMTYKPTKKSGFLDLLQAEEMKRGLQREARAEYSKLEGRQTTRGEAKEELAAQVRAAIEDAVAAQSAKAPAEAAAFEPVKAKLADLIGASNAAREGAARATRRKTVSLSDSVMAAGGMAAGGPAGAVASGVGNKLLSSRGPSTAAWAANKAAGGFGSLADALEAAPGVPAWLAPYAEQIMSPVRRSEPVPARPVSLAPSFAALDPKRRALLAAMQEGEPQ